MLFTFCIICVICKLWFRNVGQVWQLYKIERSAIRILYQNNIFLEKGFHFIFVKYVATVNILFDINCWVLIMLNRLQNLLNNNSLWLTICVQPWLFVCRTENFDNLKWRPLLNLNIFLIFRAFWRSMWRFYSSKFYKKTWFVSFPRWITIWVTIWIWMGLWE